MRIVFILWCLLVSHNNPFILLDGINVSVRCTAILPWPPHKKRTVRSKCDASSMKLSVVVVQMSRICIGTKLHDILYDHVSPVGQSFHENSQLLFNASIV